MLSHGLGAVLFLTLTRDHHGDGDGVGVSTQYAGYIISANEAPHPRGGDKPGHTSGVTCKYTPWHANGQTNGGLEFVDPGSNPNGEPHGKGAYYLVECSDGYRDVVWIQRRGAGVTPEQLARRAYALLRIASPTVLTAPPRGREGLVGLAHWFYVPQAEWEAKFRRLQVGAVWAEATATPTTMTVSPGDGTTVTCNGPGTAYDPARPAADQRSTCSHRYVHPSSAYQAKVTVTWSGTWRGSGGTGGTLPPITRSVTFPVRVAEAQALVTKG